MRGIMIEPIAAESATAEPETEPNMVQAETVTTPSPPGMKASSERAKSIRRLPTPPWVISSPVKMKSGIAARCSGSTLEM
jgi:hypothetical protein